MYKDVLAAIKSLESFASSVGTRGEAIPPFPRAAAETLGATRDPALPDGLAEKAARALVAAARAVVDEAFDPLARAPYPAQDLIALRTGLDAMGALRAAPDESVPFLAELLQRTTYEAYGGDEKTSSHYRGGSAIDDAHDELSAACVMAIARYRAHAAAGMDALKNAFGHRNREVRGLAKDVFAAIEYHIS